jgi:hypothetical protein
MHKKSFPVYIRKKHLYQISVFIFNMNYWYEIIESYDSESKDLERRDDGTYSQLSVVVLLTYLSFGRDYPYHIAKYFEKLPNKDLEDEPRSSALRHTGRIGILLNKMKDDGLVIVDEIPAKGGRRKYYKINPRIIQSPIREEAYFRRDGSLYEINIEQIEGFLNWLEKSNKEDSMRNSIFRNTIVPNMLNYLTFIIFLEQQAIKWEKLSSDATGSRNPINSESKPMLSNQIWDIVEELLYELQISATVINEYLWRKRHEPSRSTQSQAISRPR